MLNQALLKFRYDEGYAPACGYWEVNPYGAAVCAEENEKGLCTKHVLVSTGGALPDDYNGQFSECQTVYNSILKNLNFQKICDANAYDNGCIPKYEGVDTIYLSNNPDKSQTEATSETKVLEMFSQEHILNGKAFVTNDGMIFIPYAEFSRPIMAVDLNGQKGPNKWGTDLHVFIIKRPGGSTTTVPRAIPYVSRYLLEKGGVTTNILLGLD